MKFVNNTKNYQKASRTMTKLTYCDCGTLSTLGAIRSSRGLVMCGTCGKVLGDLEKARVYRQIPIKVTQVHQIPVTYEPSEHRVLFLHKQYTGGIFKVRKPHKKVNLIF